MGGERWRLLMFTRRRFVAAGAALSAAPGVLYAQQCRITPRDALGPFYKSGAPFQAELCASGGGEKLLVTGRATSTIA